MSANAQSPTEETTVIQQLTDIQKTEITEIITLALEKTQIDTSWASIIDHISDGLAQLAETMGVQVKELLQQPVAIVAMGLVVYHFAGSIVIGLIWFCLATPLLILFFLKAVVPVTGYMQVEKGTWFQPSTNRTRYKKLRRVPDFAMRDTGPGPDWVFALFCIGHAIMTLTTLIP
jgi:hypothetical protein